ncbi:single-stranded DNA-binding protein [Clostridium chromiireducens]|jgi:single stranded DNA-binding protein (ssb)|uniref:Single-stranded DNA-binding protein n=1 Tax=Clostridium chromiireducens TaxID=225345 RepID=A0A964W1Q8_9CLOT|nr:single-stranded DNA-binding protein [Clostridium chromiireducens]MVX63726.1 single-stranded DNA-binding protein [Clostridium chromiireducens]
MGSVDLNSVDLIGRLTKDPVLRQTSNNKSVVTFNIAVNKGNEQADFIPIVVWNKQAEYVAKYFHQGDKISVNKGRLSTRTYDAGDGSKRTVIEVIAANFNGVTLVSKKKNENISVQSNITNEKEEVRNNSFNNEFSTNEISDEAIFGGKYVSENNSEEDELFKMNTGTFGNFDW